MKEIDAFWSQEPGLLYLTEEAIQRNYLMLQNEINFPLQGEASMPLMSNGASQADFKICSSNSTIFLSEKSEIPNTPTSEINIAETDRHQRKRMADKAYRNREKERKRKLECDLSELHEENKILKNDNNALKKERDMMTTDLQSANSETKRLKDEICKLKRSITAQEFLVNTFCNKVINYDHQQEVTRLKSKISVLSQSSKLEDWKTEKGELLNKMASLNNEKKMLRVHVETLCSKIMNDAK